MHFSHEQVVFQEVPDEVSLAYTISGCPLRCPGCHSAYTWPPETGTLLSEDYFCQRLQTYAGLITCVLFMGGEWLEAQLLPLLKMARQQGLKTCLYTGHDRVTPELEAELTYLKTGPWIRELGGLDSPTTNQRFTDLRTNQCLNYKFQ